MLFISSINHCKAINLNNNLLIQTTREDLPMSLIENWLTKPLSSVKHLHLKLRSNSYRQDADNAYTQWFLNQMYVPITISEYKLVINKTYVATNDHNRKNFVIVTSMTRLRYTARQFGQKAGIFFFIVNGIIDFEELRNIFHLGWKRLQMFENFLLTDNGVLIYDPFALDQSGIYGKIIKYTGKESMERTIFYNMRGYPLRVQMFKSVYSEIEIDSIAKTVKRVYGVDGRVANLLQEHMNFTMNLQYPDQNYFG